MRLSYKLSACMGALTAVMAALACIMMVQMSSINNVATQLSGANIPAIIAADTINNSTSEYRIGESRYASTSDSGIRTTQKQRMEKQTALIDTNRAILQKLMDTDVERGLFDRYLSARAQYRQTSEQLLKLADEGKADEAMAYFGGPSQQAYLDLCDAINALVDNQQRQADVINAEADATYSQARAISAGLVMAAILIALGLTLFTVRNTLAQLGKDPGDLAAIARRVTGGDYAVEDGSPRRGVYGDIVGMVEALQKHIENARRESEHARNESKKAHEAMEQAEAAEREAQSKTERMLTAADRLEEVAGIVSSASTQLSAQIEQSDRGASESADRLAQAATAMNEMNATVLEVAKNAGTASDLSASTRRTAQEGVDIVERVVQSIQAVQSQSLTLKEDMARLNEQARSIDRIMNVISDIADQTNLLALNAAIEAARAGEAGRGFAVVADEVRKLAEKTMSSTSDVGNAIRAIQEGVDTSMTGVDHASDLVDQATTLANQSGEALHHIVAQMDDTADQVRAIAAASEEQSAASEEINASIAEVNATASQTAAAIQRAARAVTDLAGQAQSLTTLIVDMKQG